MLQLDTNHSLDERELFCRNEIGPAATVSEERVRDLKRWLARNDLLSAHLAVAHTNDPGDNWLYNLVAGRTGEP
jgi:hypothetical protein